MLLSCATRLGERKRRRCMPFQVAVSTRQRLVTAIKLLNFEILYKETHCHGKLCQGQISSSIDIHCSIRPSSVIRVRLSFRFAQTFNLVIHAHGSLGHLPARVQHEAGCLYSYRPKVPTGRCSRSRVHSSQKGDCATYYQSHMMT